QGSGYLGQGDVDGAEDDAQFFVDHQHGDLFAVAAFGKDFGVAGMRHAGLLQGLFVEGRGHDGAEVAGGGIVNGTAKVFVCGAASVGTDLAGCNGVRQGLPWVDDANGAGWQVECLGSGSQFGDGQVPGGGQLCSGLAQGVGITDDHGRVGQTPGKHADDDLGS